METDKLKSASRGTVQFVHPGLTEGLSREEGNLKNPTINLGVEFCRNKKRQASQKLISQSTKHINPISLPLFVRIRLQDRQLSYKGCPPLQTKCVTEFGYRKLP